MSKNKNIQKGFTLVELLVTISILAILITVSVVGYVSFIEKTYISNDEALISQLNVFKDAYLVGKEEIKESNVNQITYEVITQSNVGQLNLKSKEYGYELYFDSVSQKYILILKEEYNENLHFKIDLNYSPDVDNDQVPDYTELPDITETPNSPNNSDNGTEEENDNSSTVPTVLKLKDFVYDQDIPDKEDTYLYASDGIIYVGIMIDYSSNSKLTSVVLDSSILKVTDNISENNEYKIIDISLEDNTINESYTFTEANEYVLSITVLNNIEKEETMLIPVICRNVLINDATMSVEDNIAKINNIENQDGIYSFDIVINKLKRNITVTDYIISTSQYEQSSLYNQKLFEERTVIIIKINDEICEYLTGSLDNSYTFSFNNVESIDNDFSCSIIIKYHGTNGKWIENTITLK